MAFLWNFWGNLPILRCDLISLTHSSVPIGKRLTASLWWLIINWRFCYRLPYSALLWNKWEGSWNLQNGEALSMLYVFFSVFLNSDCCVEISRGEADLDSNLKESVVSPKKDHTVPHSTKISVQRDSKRWTQFRTSVFPELYTVCEWSTFVRGSPKFSNTTARALA